MEGGGAGRELHCTHPAPGQPSRALVPRWSSLAPITLRGDTRRISTPSFPTPHSVDGLRGPRAPSCPPLHSPEPRGAPAGHQRPGGSSTHERGRDPRRPHGQGRSSAPRSSHPPLSPCRYLGTLPPRSTPLIAAVLTLGGEKNPKAGYCRTYTNIPLPKAFLATAFPCLPLLQCPWGGCRVPEGHSLTRAPLGPRSPPFPFLPSAPACPWKRKQGCRLGVHRGGREMPPRGVTHLLPFGTGWSGCSLGALGSGQTLGNRERWMRDAREHWWGGHPPARPPAGGGHQHPPGTLAQGGGRHLKSSAPRAAGDTLHPTRPRQPLQRESGEGAAGTPVGVPALAGASLTSPGHLHSPSIPRGWGCRGSPSCPARRRDGSGSSGEMSPVPGTDGRTPASWGAASPTCAPCCPFWHEVCGGKRHQWPHPQHRDTWHRVTWREPWCPPCSWHLPGKRVVPGVPLAPGDRPGRGLPGNRRR